MARKAEIKNNTQKREGRKAETAGTRKCWPLFCVRWVVRSEKWHDHINPVFNFNVTVEIHLDHSAQQIFDCPWVLLLSIYSLKLLNFQSKVRDKSDFFIHTHNSNTPKKHFDTLYVQVVDAFIVYWARSSFILKAIWKMPVICVSDNQLLRHLKSNFSMFSYLKNLIDCFSADINSPLFQNPHQWQKPSV